MTSNQQPQTALKSALAKAQGEFSPLAKNRKVRITMKSGGSYEFRYADHQAINDATRPAMSKHGLSYTQVIRGKDLITTLHHADGGEIVSIVALPSSGDDIKNFGAAISYLKRYTISALLGVAADDDLDEDGQDGGEGDKDGKTLAQWEASDDHAEGNAQRKAPATAKGTTALASVGERNWLKNNAGDQLGVLLKSVECADLEQLTNAQFITLRNKLKNAA